jgi:hypothetical protein
MAHLHPCCVQVNVPLKRIDVWRKNRTAATCVQASPSPAIQVQWAQHNCPVFLEISQDFRGVSMRLWEWRTYSSIEFQAKMLTTTTNLKVAGAYPSNHNIFLSNTMCTKILYPAMHWQIGCGPMHASKHFWDLINLLGCYEAGLMDYIGSNIWTVNERKHGHSTMVFPAVEDLATPPTSSIFAK